MSELAAPLANPFSRLSTREQLQPIFPKYHDKVIEITIWNPPRARSRQISSTEISKLIKTSSSSASSQRVIFWPHRTSHPQESSHIQVHCKPCLFSRAQLTALPLRPAPAPSSRVTVNCSQAAELGGRGGEAPRGQEPGAPTQGRPLGDPISHGARPRCPLSPAGLRPAHLMPPRTLCAAGSDAPSSLPCRPKSSPGPGSGTCSSSSSPHTWTQRRRRRLVRPAAPSGWTGGGGERREKARRWRWGRGGVEGSGRMTRGRAGRRRAQRSSPPEGRPGGLCCGTCFSQPGRSGHTAHSPLRPGDGEGAQPGGETEGRGGLAA